MLRYSGTWIQGKDSNLLVPLLSPVYGANNFLITSPVSTKYRAESAVYK